MVLDTNNNSVFKLNYKLILVINYGKKVIDYRISLRLKEIFHSIAPKYNITPVDWDYDKEHLQLTFRAAPNSELSKCINAYKSASSRLIKNEFSQVKKLLHKEIFWSRGYCLVTLGEGNENAISNYIHIQEMKDVGEFDCE